MQNILKITENNYEQKGKMKQKFALLTGNDNLLLEGILEEQLGLLQAKLAREFSYLKINNIQHCQSKYSIDIPALAVA